MLKHKPYLCAIMQSKDEGQRKALIKCANDEIIREFFELIENIMNGNIHLSDKRKNNLKEFQNTLRLLRDTPFRRQKLLQQSGSGIFSFLLPILSSL